MIHAPFDSIAPIREINVVEASRDVLTGRHCFDLERDFRCNPSTLVSYAFGTWEPVIADAMVVAGSIEHADGKFKRPEGGWARDFSLSIPVSEPQRWNKPEVLMALIDVCVKLTGDSWNFDFRRRSAAPLSPNQPSFPFQNQIKAVMPCSVGMDSFATAGLLSADLNESFLCVRLGPKSGRSPNDSGKRRPFTSVPYSVRKKGFRESSARSRGFKFAMISGIAAYLTGASQIALPESGQGVFGPALLQPGSIYPDLRNHPFFTTRMEALFKVLLGIDVKFVFPRLWHTKGETLHDMLSKTPSDGWQATKSCWKQRQPSVVNRKQRQCGACAACFLRRVGVFAANLQEKNETYVSNNTNASSFEGSFDIDFKGAKSGAAREYAIAGVLHMDELARLGDASSRAMLSRHAKLLGHFAGYDAGLAEERLASLFNRHAVEWRGYLRSLDPNSFIRNWTRTEL